MCLPKKREKTKENKQKLEKLLKKHKDLLNKDSYPRFFLQILTFMEESIKQEISSPVVGFCSCSNIPDSYVRQRFHQAYQDCSTSEKIQYLALAHHAIQNSPKTQIVENIMTKFTITIRNFFPWTTQETVRLNGFRFATETYEIDLRRYLVRQSRSGINRSFVLQAITEIKPEKVRFSFDESDHVNEDIADFLEAAKLGFLHTAEIWSHKIERFDLRPPSLIKQKEKRKNVQFQSEKKWSEIFKQTGQSQDGEKKVEKEPQVKRFKFTESSEEEEEQEIHQKERKVRTQVSQTIHHLQLKNQTPHKIVVTAPPTTLPSLKGKNDAKKRKPSMSLLAYEPMSRNEKNIISNLIPNYNILKIEDLSDFNEESKQEGRDNRINIYKHKEKKQIKCRMKLQALTNLVVLGILDYPHYRDWNEYVKSAEIHMKLQAENCIMSSLYFNHSMKPFLFMSHLCEYQNQHYIVMKCLQEDKSYFNSHVIKVWREKNHTQIFFHLAYEKESNAVFLQKLLQSYEELETYLSTKLAKDSIKKYLKFGRKIDKEINRNEEVEEDRRSNEYSYGSWEFGNASELEKGLEEVGHLPSFYSVSSYEEKK